MKRVPGPLRATRRPVQGVIQGKAWVAMDMHDFASNDAVGAVSRAPQSTIRMGMSTCPCLSLSAGKRTRVGYTLPDGCNPTTRLDVSRSDVNLKEGFPGSSKVLDE